jgi:uncharacterized protein YjiS (DUF1127 family)
MANPFSLRHLYITIIKNFQNYIANTKAEHSRRVACENSYAALLSMSTSELREFGLHRSDLPAMARASVLKS